MQNVKTESSEQLDLGVEELESLDALRRGVNWGDFGAGAAFGLGGVALWVAVAT